jgi:beta-ribofuranosylaminobenzene 5'-phosphate synthase
VERVAHLVLMQLLPALVEGDLASFGAALTEVQRVTGAWFAPQQGGVFAPGPSAALVRHMAGWGAVGVGQSSWGPAVYGLAGSESEGKAIAARAADLLGAGGRVFEGGFAASGASVRRGPGAEPPD